MAGERGKIGTNSEAEEADNHEKRTGSEVVVEVVEEDRSKNRNPIIVW